jgi:pimeloyl-ACP methyl ester carboxylesterase
MLNPIVGLLLVLGAPAGGTEAPESAWLLGDWLGELRLGAEPTPVKLHCKMQAEAIQVSADFPPFGPRGLAVRTIRVARTTVALELAGDGGTFLLDGRLEENALVGEVRRGADRGTFRMIRLARVEGKRLTACRGAYRAGPDHYLWVSPFGELGGGLFFLDSQSGRFGPLHAESDSEFFSGPAVVVPVFPADVRVAFHRKANDTVSGLTLRQGKAPEVRATRILLRTEEVHFSNGSVTLHGTLTAPPQGGPHAAIALVHGSGPEDRDFLGPWVEFFASQGLTVLAYDKRGVGASGGDWKRATLDDLAGDVAAAVGLLQARSDVDPRRVGLFGISQGGWVAPRAARRTKGVAFMILHAGPAVPVVRQGLLSLEHTLRAYGFGQQEIEEAIAYQKLDDAFTRTGEGWDRLQAAYQKAAARKAEWVEPPRPKDDWFRPFYRAIMDHDPVPDLEQLRCPVLAFFGEVDVDVPPEPNKTLMERALVAAGNRDQTIVVLAKANHLFLQAQTGVKTEYPRLRTFVPGYFDTMASWLRRQALVPR